MNERNGRLMLAVLSTIALTACQTIPITGTIGPDNAQPAVDVSRICEEWRQIPFSEHGDTLETIQVVRGNNAARKAFCED